MAESDFKKSSKRIGTQGATAGVLLYTLIGFGVIALIVIGLLLLFQ
ncbi:MAG: hypothetical protein ACJ74J_05500 [Blastocatellia bacterium]